MRSSSSPAEAPPNEQDPNYFDKNKKSLNIKNILLKISSNNFQNKNLIIVIEDGFMLHTLKRKKIPINFSMINSKLCFL